MKKTLYAAALIAALSSVSAAAQAVEEPGFFDNITIGLDGGVTTPMHNGPFFGGMRGVAGLHIGKQITPVLGAGIEGAFAVNTSSWRGFPHSSTAFDNSYIGLYATADLFNLFGGYNCSVRPFTIEAVLGAGWGHDYYAKSDGVSDWNYFATKAGLNFNFNVTDNFSISIKPSIVWNMNGNFEQSGTGYNINNATFNLLAGLNYRFGSGFECVRPYDQAEVYALNSQINELRGKLDSSVASADAWQTKANALAAELDSCRNRKPEVVKEVSNQYNSVRFVFFRIGSYKITADQMPNVEMIADYMKNHPQSKVIVKGYASRDGNYDFNVRLAKNRADAVRNALISKYRVNPDRIVAQGEGIGDMFEEESWNRVSICTLETE